MDGASRTIRINKIRKPRNNALNEELQWFFESLGILGNRDKDKSCFRTAITLLKNVEKEEGMTSDEISRKVNLSRGTVVHHLHRLIDLGIVVNYRNKYMLRVGSLTRLVEEIERDFYSAIDDIKKAAVEIDKKLDL